MRTSLLFIALIVGAAIISSVGFQCASTQMTSAKLYIQQEKWGKAIESLEQEVAKKPASEEAWFLLGRVKGQLGDFSGMNDAFRRALEVGQTYAKDIHDTKVGYWANKMNAGVDFFNKGRDTTEYLDKGIAVFKTAIVIIPDSAAAYKNLGFSYLVKNEIENALAPLEKAFDLSKDPAIGKYVGEINYDLGVRHKEKFESPLNKIEIRIQMTPDEVRSQLGEPPSKTSKKEKRVTTEKWVYESQQVVLNFENGLLKSWEEAGKREEKEPKVYYKNYVEHDSAMGYFDKAIEVLERLLKLDPDNADLLGVLSNAYIAADKADVAIETFRRGVTADPSNKFFRYNYGVLLMKAEDFENATEQFLAAVAIDSTYESALYNLGVVYVNWGVHIREAAEDPSKVESVYKEKFRLGLPYLERMTRLKPENPETWELLGRVYANFGRSKDATVAFEKADKLRDMK